MGLSPQAFLQSSVLLKVHSALCPQDMPERDTKIGTEKRQFYSWALQIRGHNPKGRTLIDIKALQMRGCGWWRVEASRRAGQGLLGEPPVLPSPQLLYRAQGSIRAT